MHYLKKTCCLTVSVIALASTAAFANESKDWSQSQPSTLWDKTWRYSDKSINTNRKNHVQHDFFVRKANKQAVAAPAQAPAPANDPNYNDLPLNPKIGECYARVQIPPEYKMVSEKVLVKKASVNYTIVPAEYKSVEGKVLVAPAKDELQVVAATYRDVQERVLVADAYDEIVTIPAQYKTQTQKILVSPAYSTWKKGRGPIEKVNNITGDIMCLVEVPAEYKTITTDVLVKPASTRLIKHPAQYKTITRSVLDKPAYTKTVTITPARYEAVKIKKLVKASYKKEHHNAAEYKTVERRVPLSGGTIQWRSILCETNATPELFSALQTALKARNIYSGAVTGVLDNATMDAVIAFQKSKNLPSGDVTIATLKALNITNW